MSSRWICAKKSLEMPVDDASWRYIQEKNIRIIIELEISKIKRRSSSIKGQTAWTSDMLDKTKYPAKFFSINSDIITKIDRFMSKMQIISKNISKIESEIIWEN